jgi:hypothetical protein
MAEWIGQLAIAVAPEHVGRRHVGFRAARRLVGQHDSRVADGEFGVADLASGHLHDGYVGGAKRLLVEFDGSRGIPDHQVRRHRMVALWYWLCHFPSF